jgi:cell division protein FtsL
MTRQFRFRALFVLFAIALIAVPMTATYVTSYQIDELQRQKLVLEASIAQERNSIRVLQAEWAYLAEPKRIERLAAAHLNMLPNTNKATAGTRLALAKDFDRLTTPAAAPIVVAAAAPAPTKVSAAPSTTHKKIVVADNPSSTSASNTPDGVKLVLASFKAQ